jgi:hypothetical protein
MLDGTVLILIMTIGLPVQRLGASRIAHRLPLDARRTRQPHGTPTGAAPRRPVSPRVAPDPWLASTAQDLLEASPAHQFSGQARESEHKALTS